MSGFRSLVKHILIYGSGVWAGKAIGFIMIPVYTRALTPADYGALELISRTSDVIAMLLGMGLAAALFRFHAECKSEKQKEATITTAVVFAGMVGCCATFTLAWLAPYLSGPVLGSSIYGPLLRIALIATGLELCTMAPMAVLRIHERSALFTIANLGRLVISLSLNIYLVVLLRMGVLGILLSNLASVSVMLVYLFVLTAHYWKPRVDMALLKPMLAYSLPLVPASFAMFVLNFGDRYFIRSCCSLQVLGVYSLGYKLCMVMPALVMEPMGLAWSAAVFPIAHRNDANAVYARYFKGYLFCVAFFSLGLAVLSRDLIAIMAASEYREAYRIVPVVLLGFLAWAGANVFEIGIFLEKKTYYRTLATWLAAVVAIASYALLVPRYQAMGAAWATVCSFGVMAGAIYLISRRVHPIQYNLRSAFKLVAAGVGMYALAQSVPGDGIVGSIAVRALIVIFYPVVLYGLGYFGPEDVSAARGVVVAVLARAGLVNETA